MVFGYDLLCDLLELSVEFNKYRSAVATRRNLVDPIQRMNMRGLMAEMFRAFEFDFSFKFFSTFIRVQMIFFSICHKWNGIRFHRLQKSITSQ
jgi:hypothetical protein